MIGEVTKTRARVALIAVAVLLLAGNWLYESAWSNCVRDVRYEDYPAASNSCSRAKSIGWVFQKLKPVQYAGVLNNFGLARLSLQDYPTAKRHLEESVRRLRVLVPDGSRTEAVALSSLGLLSQREGDLVHQEQWNRQSVAMFDALRLSCDRSAAMAESNLGSALAALGRLEEAEATLLRRIERNGECPNVPAYVRGSTLRRLGETQTRLNDEAQALTTFDSAMELLRQDHGDSSRELALTLLSRASTLRRLDRCADAEKDTGLAMPMLTRWVGPDTPEVGTARSVLGQCFRQQSLHSRSLTEFKEAERIYRLRLGPDHPWLATLLLQMARTHQAMGQVEQGRLALKEAERIRIVAFGEGSRQVQRVRDELHDIDETP